MFSALIHVALGVYLQILPKTWRNVLQMFGSMQLILASGLLIWGFVSETYFLKTFSDLSRFGISLLLAGIGFHLIGGFLVHHER